jgi:hypothetical protein
LPDKESKAAAWGTACHEIAECSLREQAATPHFFIGTYRPTKDHEIEVDEEMAETAFVYCDYVLGAAAHPDNKLYIERQFSLAKLNPPFEAGGTADAVVYHAKDQLLEVIDLKGGRGKVVEAKGNPQARTYAIGALLAFPELKVTHVKSTIVQPRAYHPDGRIRSETLHVGELMDWTTDLLLAMDRSFAAVEEWEADKDAKSFAALYLNPGDHCGFCKAAATCPALESKAMEKALTHFKPLGEVAEPPAAATLDVDQVAKILDAADMIENWLNSVRAHGHSLAESGVEVPGYQLVAKQGRRKWADEEAASKFLDWHIDELGAYAPRKLKSPAQVEKLLKLNPEEQKFFAALCPAVSSGTNLVATAKTTRPAVQPGAQSHFKALE